MTRIMAHSLNAIANSQGISFECWSAYDHDKDLIEKYLPAEKFKGYGSNRMDLVVKSIAAKNKPDVVILSHINMAVIGLFIKALNPKCKLFLVAHGIEVWRPLSYFKKLFLRLCNKVICVSEFTKQQMIARHNTSPEKCLVVNNVIDPFMELPESFDKPAKLLKRYNLNSNQPIIFTLTRLASTEQYKGHDQVIKAIGSLKDKFDGLKYILAGKYDEKEEKRIKDLINDYEVDDHVILTGYIEESELSDHFLLADVFVLPSKKEGFGIVFIEALACGLPVICGNADGSVDAICNGELGTAINPDDANELENALTNQLNKQLTLAEKKNLQDKCLANFSETAYISKLEHILAND